MKIMKVVQLCGYNKSHELYPLDGRVVWYVNALSVKLLGKKILGADFDSQDDLSFGEWALNPAAGQLSH